MSDRETITINTPIDSHELVLKTYLTGRESRIIQNVFIGTQNIDPENPQARVSGELIDQANDKAIELIVVSFDKVSEGVVEKVLDLKKPDYDFVMKEINAIQNGEQYKKKA